MNYKVISIALFDKQAKRLSKKFPSLKNELSSLINSLQKEPRQGAPLGNDCFKIRIAIRSKGKGKSGGGRIITHFYIADSAVYLLTIYDKSEQSDISDEQIKQLLKLI